MPIENLSNLDVHLLDTQMDHFDIHKYIFLQDSSLYEHQTIVKSSYFTVESYRKWILNADFWHSSFELPYVNIDHCFKKEKNSTR